MDVCVFAFRSRVTKAPKYLTNRTSRLAGRCCAIYLARSISNEHTIHASLQCCNLRVVSGRQEGSRRLFLSVCCCWWWWRKRPTQELKWKFSFKLNISIGIHLLTTWACIRRNGANEKTNGVQVVFIGRARLLVGANLEQFCQRYFSL